VQLKIQSHENVVKSDVEELSSVGKHRAGNAELVATHSLTRLLLLCLNLKSMKSSYTLCSQVGTEGTER
jgi:hypothetical protein